jgi:hypothetical protein
MRRFDPDCEDRGRENVSGREVRDASFSAVGSGTRLRGMCEIVTSMIESVSRQFPPDSVANPEQTDWKVYVFTDHVLEATAELIHCKVGLVGTEGQPQRL